MDKLVSFETALLAKELGFNGGCYNYYWEEKNGRLNTMTWGTKLITNKELIWCSKNYQKGLQDCKFCSAPTQAHLQKWLRERGIMIWVEPTYYDGWLYACNVSYPNGLYETVGIENGTWDEQLKEGLISGLNFIKENSSADL